MSDVVGAWTRWVSVLLCFCFRIFCFTYAIHTGVSSHSHTRAVGWCDLQHAQASIQLPPCQWPIQPRGRAPLSLVQSALQRAFQVESSTQHRNRTQQNYVFVQAWEFWYLTQICTFFVPHPGRFSLALEDLQATPVSIQVPPVSLVRQRCDSSRQTR